MNSKQTKTLKAIFSKPTSTNIKFTDIESVLITIGTEKVEGHGSRVRFLLSNETLHLHRPHPEAEAKRYQVELVREFLEKLGITP